MIPLRDTLPNHLQHTLQLLDRADNSAIDKVEFRRNGRAEFFAYSQVFIYVSKGTSGLGVFADQIQLASDGSEDGTEVVGESDTGGEQT